MICLSSNPPTTNLKKHSRNRSKRHEGVITLNTNIADTKQEMGKRAAEVGAGIICKAIDARGSANIIVATGASQFEMLEALAKQPNIRWDKVTGFQDRKSTRLNSSH